MITLILAAVVLVFLAQLKRGTANAADNGSLAAGRVVDCATWSPPAYRAGDGQRWLFNPRSTFGVVCSDGSGAWSLARVNPQTGEPLNAAMAGYRMAPFSSSQNGGVQTGSGTSEEEEGGTWRERVRDWWEDLGEDFQEGWDDASAWTDSD